MGDIHVKGISVIMPTYNQGAFISRALASIQAQNFINWELIIVNDGSTDYTADVLSDFLEDKRISCYHNEVNQGLGYSINKGISNAKFDLIAYLPSDDLFFADHLQLLYQTIMARPEVNLVYTGMKLSDHESDDEDSMQDIHVPSDGALQLVQVLHRKTSERWMERSQLVTDDLNKMFFSGLIGATEMVSTNRVTCEWVFHSEQRCKIIRETDGGGINRYKEFYNVRTLLKYQSSVGNYIDEEEMFREFRTPFQPAANGLKILLVGELAYNAERIYALEERGHKLYGLWMNEPNCYNTTGPLPFGNVEDISFDNWEERVNEIKPDIIYALLNYQAVPFAHYVMTKSPGIPFVWHFKEGPFICRANGIWKELVELYCNSDGQIYTNPEVRDWFNQFIKSEQGHSFLLDGDLPKQNYFKEERSPLLSDQDGEIHTVVPGRPFGISPGDIRELARQKIHFHFYGEFQQNFWTGWIQAVKSIAPEYFHMHPNCDAKDWTKEFSKYDAGWLHIKSSKNHNEMMKVNWYDLNYAARMTTLAAAGLPMLQKENKGHISATYALIDGLDVGVTFNSFNQLGELLRDKSRMQQLRQNIWEKRMIFSFDYHVDDLIVFFRKVIKNKKEAELKEAVYDESL